MDSVTRAWCVRRKHFYVAAGMRKLQRRTRLNPVMSGQYRSYRICAFPWDYEQKVY